MNNLRRHKIVCFFALTFLISWGAWYGMALFEMTLSGIGGLIGVLGAFGPTFAGLICNRLLEGRKGHIPLLKRIFAWRVSPLVYLAIFLAPLLVSGAALMMNELLGGPKPTWERLSLLPTLLPTFAYMLVIGGLTEEPGWRGYALPHLKERHSRLIASLILGLMWGIWHIPIYTLPSMGNPISPADLFMFILSTPLLAILFTAVADWSKDSVLIAILLHAWNNTVGFSGLAQLLGTPINDQLETLFVVALLLFDTLLVAGWIFGRKSIRPEPSPVA